MASDAGVDESHAMRVYRKEHGKEEELNKNFNTYVHVLKAIYAGRNRVSAQLHRRITNEGCVRGDHLSELYCEPPGEDLALPLGREFQAFVDLCSAPGKESYTRVMNASVGMMVKHFRTAKQQAGAMDADMRERQNDVLAKLLQVFRGILHNESKVFLPLTLTLTLASSTVKHNHNQLNSWHRNRRHRHLSHFET